MPQKYLTKNKKQKNHQQQRKQTKKQNPKTIKWKIAGHSSANDKHFKQHPTNLGILSGSTSYFGFLNFTEIHVINI